MEAIKGMSEHPKVVLIVDDDSDIRSILTLLLGNAGYLVVAAQDGAEALRQARTCDPCLAILDYRLPDMTGLDVLRRLQIVAPHLPVIMLTGFADLSVAVASIKEGAFDYISKPFDNKEFLGKVRDAFRYRSNPATVSEAVVGLRERMGPSPAIARTILDVERVATTDFAVSLQGETGSGKEVIARAIHSASSRATHPFVAVDCGSIPDTLIENELFGHERGAYTGAERQQPGKLESAQGGTLFLDEICNLSWSAQARLLRVLQERVLFRVGGTKPIPIDVRLISASHRDLAEEVAKGSFREDLLYRLCDYRIAIPPLRDRREDIPFIAGTFLNEANRELGKEVRGFSDEAIQAMLGYRWPGNVRQLRSVVRRAVLLASYLIDASHLALPEVTGGETAAPVAVNVSLDGRSLKETLQLHMADVERQILREALKHAQGNKAAVARLLRVDYKTVHTKIKAYGLGA
jgi:two-component system nitrogen regulation response regulator GlnG